MRRILYFFEQSWLLLIASFVFGLLLALTNAAWRPRILENEARAFVREASRQFDAPDVAFQPVAESITVDTPKGRRDIQLKEALAGGQRIGWAFLAEGSGFADTIRLVVAVDERFETLKGFGVLGSNETPGFGDKMKTPYFQDQFESIPVAPLELAKTGDPAEKDETIVAISGATVTSEAVVSIFNTYLDQVREQLVARGLIQNGK